MKCLRCEADMFPAIMTGNVKSLELHLTDRKYGLFETENQCDITCYVCPACGYIELNANDPQKIKPDSAQ